MIKKVRLSDRDEWLKERKKRIGGSECAAILGLNPWLTNVDLWRIKTGRMERKAVTNLAAVEYGQKAEEHLRELFKLDFPQFQVWHEPDTLFVNSEIPEAHASVDGILTDEDGRRGILEIKTSTMMTGAMWKKWDGQVPAAYFCQVLLYMAVLEADFTVLKAQLKSPTPDGCFLTTRHYFIERKDCEEDIAYLLEKLREFSKHIEEDTEPALVLPDI